MTPDVGIRHGHGPERTTDALPAKAPGIVGATIIVAVSRSALRRTTPTTTPDLRAMGPRTSMTASKEYSAGPPPSPIQALVGGSEEPTAEIAGMAPFRRRRRLHPEVLTYLRVITVTDPARAMRARPV